MDRLPRSVGWICPPDGPYSRADFPQVKGRAAQGVYRECSARDARHNIVLCAPTKLRDI